MIEHRHDERHSLEDTSVHVEDVESGVEFTGEARNVSGDGLCFDTALEPPVGAEMNVELGGKEHARGRLAVTRVEKAEKGFRVSGHFARVK